MKNTTRQLSALLLLISGAIAMPAWAVPIFYADRPTFDAAAPGLTLEDFENSLVNPGQIATCSGTVSSASNDACFAPGGIQPGISFSAVGTGFNEIVAIGDGFVGNSTTVLGPNSFADDLDLMLSVVGGANAIGMDILAAANSGDLLINVFGAGGLLGSTTLSFVGGDTQFMGVIASESITQILFDDGNFVIGELIDNVAFGSTVSDVPEPGTLALLGLGLAGMGFARRKKT